MDEVALRLRLPANVALVINHNTHNYIIINKINDVCDVCETLVRPVVHHRADGRVSAPMMLIKVSATDVLWRLQRLLMAAPAGLNAVFTGEDHSLHRLELQMQRQLQTQVLTGTSDGSAGFWGGVTTFITTMTSPRFSSTSSVQKNQNVPLSHLHSVQ